MGILLGLFMPDQWLKQSIQCYIITAMLHNLDFLSSVNFGQVADMHFVLPKMTLCLVWILVKLQKYRQTYRIWCIWAHRAYAQVVSINKGNKRNNNNSFIVYILVNRFTVRLIYISQFQRRTYNVNVRNASIQYLVAATNTCTPNVIW